MPTTDLGLVYPTSSGSSEIWTHLEDLAESADTAIQQVADDAATPPPTVADAAALDAITSPATGLHVWVTSENLFYAYTGTEWVADRQIFHYSRNKAVAQTIASGGTFAVVPFDALSYNAHSLFEYGSPLPDGHFKYVGPFTAMVYIDVTMQWEDNSSSTRDLRITRSLDDGGTWQQFDAVRDRGPISQRIHSEFLMDSGYLFRLEAANNASSGLDIGGAASANRLRVRAEFR